MTGKLDFERQEEEEEEVNEDAKRMVIMETSEMARRL